ncbi:hypothetical protein SLA_5863 [Streptomyces laurentii]|uniref:Uncharacterized protein n=1 Tax=Streptomyces laurentii TaxID=39478 RepID=A0A169P7F2_STRLU|nr:hypothetical protein SLA_5863 [Streptomyces laurentii]
MPHPARLVATLAAPLPFTGADDTSWLTPWPAARLLVQRGETELIVRQVAAPATAEPIRFPAPWPRRCGDAVVSPDATLAVFSGPHGLRAVDRTGAVRWELGHACWAPCPEGGAVTSYAADDHAHRYAPSGSTCFSADGTLVWAHVRGPLAGDAPVQGPGSGEEEWLVLDAADGSVLARAETGTAAAGSFHVPHPDPSRMGLTIGEGQDGSPLRWGRFDGRALTVDRLGDDDLVLLAVGPGGDRLLTVTHDQDTLAVRRLADGAVTAALDASAIPPRAPSPGTRRRGRTSRTRRKRTRRTSTTREASSTRTPPSSDRSRATTSTATSGTGSSTRPGWCASSGSATPSRWRSRPRPWATAPGTRRPGPTTPSTSGPADAPSASPGGPVGRAHLQVIGHMADSEPLPGVSRKRDRAAVVVLPLLWH